MSTEDDLILGEEEEIEDDFNYETIEGYTYTEYIGASCEVLNTIQSGDFMTQEDVRMAKKLRKLSLEMLVHCVTRMHEMLITNK